MADREAREAFEEFLEPLRQAAQCITYAVLFGDGYGPSHEPHIVTFPHGDPIELHGRERLKLRVVHSYRLVPMAGSRGRPKVKTVGYAYEVSSADDQLVLRYDYHPEGRSPIGWPHVHIGCETAPIDFRHKHVPTGRVAIESVFRFLITQLGIDTLKSTDECLALLDKLEDDFNDKRTW